MIFVDTSAWFAAVVPTDVNHPAASAWLAGCAEPLVTSDYVVDETLTLLRCKGENDRAVTLGEQFFDAAICDLIRLDDQDLRASWGVFRNYADKQWSFTDCSSSVLMARLGIRTAFTFDHHFRQFGTVLVMP